MARRSTGGVTIDERRKSPVFALRFRAYGRRQFVTLGSVDEGWTRQKAEDALRHVLADVERGIWRPPDRERAIAAPAQPQAPTFHEFASQWFRANEGAWRPKTRVDYQWQLSSHLLPFFAGHRLSQITIAEVDRYRAVKVREGMLSPTSINKTITRMAQILEVAVEYELIERNPAKGKRRRVKASRPAPVWLDSAGQIGALLDGAGELDARARRDRQHVQRRAILATLVFAGLRIGELCELRWRDVDLTAGRLTVRASKTDAGVRRVEMLPVLGEQLAKLPRRRPDALVFATSNGLPHGPSNIRRRILGPAVELANEQLERRGEAPLPERLSPHKLRHTFASLMVALGVDPGSVMDQLGHTDPSFTLRVYRHGMRRDEASRNALRALVGAADRAAAGSSVVNVSFAPVASEAAGMKKPRG
ncbi:MAG: tyrosine-type recombinase/integrase [Solirubrobacteraceae bacterium]